MLTLKGHGYTRTVYAVAFSPDGAELASVGLDGNVRLWDLAACKQKDVRAAHYSTRSVAYSPDGGWLAWPDEHEVKTAHTGGEFRHYHPDEEASFTQALFSADGDRLFCAYRNWHPAQDEFGVLERYDGSWEVWDGGGGCATLALSADGRTLASGHLNGLPGAYAHDVRVWDAADRTQRATLSGHGSTITALALSPDGTFLAAVSGQTLWVWDVARQEAVARKKVGKLHFKAAAFSPDGRWLATARNDATIRFYDTHGWGEGPAFDWDIGPLVSVAFAADGMRAAAGSAKGKIVVWDVDV
jgi:WD40 repeat protein